MTQQEVAVGVEDRASSSSSGAMKIVKFVVIALVVAALVYFGREAGSSFQDFAAWVQSQGTFGVVVFIAAYALGTVAMAPGSILTMAAGAIFGLAGGTAFVFVGATLGSTGSFLIGRYLARGWVEKKIGAYPKFAAIDKAIGREGRKIVFLLRLTPVFPYSLGNYMLGLTKVRLADYVLACLGMIPGTFLYVYYGKAIGDIAAIAAGTRPEGGAGSQALLWVGLVATLVVTVLVTRVARKALKDAAELDEAEGEASHG